MAAFHVWSLRLQKPILKGSSTIDMMHNIAWFSVVVGHFKSSGPRCSPGQVELLGTPLEAGIQREVMPSKQLDPFFSQISLSGRR